MNRHHGIPTLFAIGWLLSAACAVHGEPTRPAANRHHHDNGNGNGKHVIDFDTSPPLDLIISPSLSLGAKLNIEIKSENNKDLDDQKPDRLSAVASRLNLAGLYQPTPGVDLFGELRFTYENAFDDSGDRHTEVTRLEFREGFLLLRQFLADPVSLQIGRQRIKDDREWFFDERLDAVRLIYEEDRFSASLSASSMLIDPDKDEDKITNYILRATYQYGRKDKITLLAIARQDRSKRDRDPVYAGLAWSARPAKNQKFWLNAAGLWGQDGEKDLRGYGLDTGWILRFDHHLKPSITLGLALGSGDPDPDDDTDRQFQQTDLQDNNGRFNGTTKFKYYGEVFDPELSNMMVLTAGIGFTPNETFSLDLVYHYYMLQEISDELRDADVDEDLTGTDRDLGHEIDLILGMKLGEHTRLSLKSGLFIPGTAFPEDSTAYSTTLEFQITF